MKSILYWTLALLGLAAPAVTRAWTYKDGDVLLIFRESALPGTYPSPYNNVEFDLGSVTNFLGQTNGYTTTVTGWDLSKVRAVFGSDLTGVSVVLVAATSPTNPSPTAYFSAALPQNFWLNGVEPYNTAFNVSPSVWQGAWSKINAIGTRPALYLPASQRTAAYSFPPSSVLSYDRIVSSDAYVKAGAQSAISADWLPQFGGFAPFTVEGVAPGSFGFLAVAPSTAATKPLNTYIGTFTIDNLGNLTFTAGPPAPVITNIARSGNANTVTFTTGLSGSYSLLYTNQINGQSASWPIVGDSVIGDGNPNSLTHVTPDAAGFYSIVRSP